MRLTKIICTLGPTSHTPEQILALAKQGMTIARFNFSHGSHDEQRKTIDAVKEVNAKQGFSIGLMMDTKGAEIRTGDVKEPISISKGQEVVFSSVPLPKETRTVIIVNHDKFALDVQKAESILLDNGVMSFELVSLEKDGSVIARSRDDGSIGSRRHVNLPGADISLPAVMEKDWDDLRFGIEEKLDYVALSFIRTADEVLEVKEFLKKNGSTMSVMAKIETRQAVANIDAIIAASDSIMVARGDLGAEMPFEKIPAIQDMIVHKCRTAGKPVLVATQMLESMIENPMPTRAEVTDIAHAATTRADMTMLSGETASGQHPLAAVHAMHTILAETEAHQSADLQSDATCAFGEQSALADAAVSMALSTAASAIMVLTKSGKTARAVSQLRSNLPIIAFTEDEDVQRYLLLFHAIQPLVIPFENDPEKTVESAMNAGKKSGFLKKDQKVVLISDSQLPAERVRGVQLRVIR